MSKSNATVKDNTNRLQKAKSSFVQLNKVSSEAMTFAVMNAIFTIA